MGAKLALPAPACARRLDELRAAGPPQARGKFQLAGARIGASLIRLASGALHSASRAGTFQFLCRPAGTVGGRASKQLVSSRSRLPARLAAEKRPKLAGLAGASGARVLLIKRQTSVTVAINSPLRRAPAAGFLIWPPVSAASAGARGPPGRRPSGAAAASANEPPARWGRANLAARLLARCQDKSDPSKAHLDGGVGRLGGVRAPNALICCNRKRATRPSVPLSARLILAPRCACSSGAQIQSDGSGAAPGPLALTTKLEAGRT